MLDLPWSSHSALSQTNQPCCADWQGKSMSVSRISRKMDRNWERKSFIYGREKWTSSVKAKPRSLGRRTPLALHTSWRPFFRHSQLNLLPRRKVGKHWCIRGVKLMQNPGPTVVHAARIGHSMPWSLACWASLNEGLHGAGTKVNKPSRALSDLKWHEDLRVMLRMWKLDEG